MQNFWQLVDKAIETKGRKFSVNTWEEGSKVIARHIHNQEIRKKQNDIPRLVNYKIKRRDNARTILWNQARSFLSNFEWINGKEITRASEIPHSLVLTLVRKSDGSFFEFEEVWNLLETWIHKIQAWKRLKIVVKWSVSSLKAIAASKQEILDEYNRSKWK